ADADRDGAAPPAPHAGLLPHAGERARVVLDRRGDHASGAALSVPERDARRRAALRKIPVGHVGPPVARARARHARGARARSAAAALTLRVLQVAYPFAPVGPDAVGGAEVVL